MNLDASPVMWRHSNNYQFQLHFIDSDCNFPRWLHVMRFVSGSVQ